MNKGKFTPVEKLVDNIMDSQPFLFNSWNFLFKMKTFFTHVTFQLA